MTKISFPSGTPGLTKEVRLVSIEINDEQKFILVRYREYLLDANGTELSRSETKQYLLEDKAAYETTQRVPVEVDDEEGEKWEQVIIPASTKYTDWSDSEVGKAIAKAVVNRLKTIYEIAE